MADLKSNPFKKAEEKKKKAPGAPRPEDKSVEVRVEPTEPAQEPEKGEQTVNNTPEQEKPVQAVSEPISDVVKKIQSKKKENREKAAFTYYLLKDNDKKLVAAAKKAGMSKSEFLDHILSEVLK